MFPSRERVRAAMLRAAQSVRASQQSDGSWHSRNDAGALFTAAALAFERALGVLRDGDASDGARFLRHAQLADGSCEAWPFAGRGSLEATSFWLAGMRAAGVSSADPDVRRAARYVENHGGLRANRLIVRALLVAAGTLEPTALPPLPLVPRLLPGYDALLASLFGVNALIPLHTLPALVRGLRDGARPRSRLRLRAERAVVDYLTERQDPSGSWAGVPYYTLQAALTLRVCGVPVDDPRIGRAVAFSRRVWERRSDGLFVGAFESSHWDTAHMVRVLTPFEAHAPEPHALDRARRYLLAGQAKQPAPRDWQTPPDGAPLIGGWAWQPGNARNPDLDSTAEVLSALALLAQAHPSPALTVALRDGLSWLLPFQNDDGGWAAFSHGKAAAPVGPLFVRTRDPDFGARLLGAFTALRRLKAETSDPSTADVTGRVLYALGAIGFTGADARVRAAIRFLQRHQIPETGAFWSRWAVNYLPGTAYVVTGLLAVGEPPRAPMLERAVGFLLARQNHDGGWGESPDSYVDPTLAGRGPSSVQVTGVVLWALLAAGVKNETTARAVHWLLERQGPDGNWQDAACFGTIFPHLHYYHSDAFPAYFALEALHAWLG